MKDEVRRRLPDEVLDRPQVQVRVQDLVVAEQLHAVLRKGSAVLSLEQGEEIIIKEKSYRIAYRSGQ